MSVLLLKNRKFLLKIINSAHLLPIHARVKLAYNQRIGLPFLKIGKIPDRHRRTS